MLSPAALRQTLKQVIDPELFLNIVDLGLVYDVAVEAENQVVVTMTMTTPHCPMGPQIIKDVTDTVTAQGAQNVTVNVVWDPPWSPELMTPELKAELGIDESDLPAPPPPPSPIPAPAKKPGLLARIFGR